MLPENIIKPVPEFIGFTDVDCDPYRLRISEVISYAVYYTNPEVLVLRLTGLTDVRKITFKTSDDARKVIKKMDELLNVVHI